jgi:Transglycosylase SLT domain
VAGLGFFLLRGQSAEERAEEVVAAGAAAAEDYGPFAWDADRRAEFEERASVGTSHVIYALSPGGAIASAERTDAWREEIEAAAERHGVDPDHLEALVFLESAGREDVIAGETPEAAAGLGQILPSTATDLLGMEVDLPLSIKLTRQIALAEEEGKGTKAAKLRRERARIDERFDPEAALDGAARYLEIATERFDGATDLATVSYHMGIGNLESVIDAYEGDTSDLSYAQLFFDSAPDRNAEAHDILSGFADDSSLYYWRILASERVMAQWRDDCAELERTAALATAKATLEEVYQPEEETPVFEGPEAVEAATDDGELLPLPAGGAPGWSVDEQMGELAPRLDREPELYRALRPEALATLAFMGALVERLSGAEQPLRVTSAVRDLTYQDLLNDSNPEATQEYSLHTTGYSFDVLREYENDLRAAAFQFALDRLRALAVIDYAVDPRAIHVTVSPLGRQLLEP